MPPGRNHSAAIETTGYATLALLEHGDKLNASRAARWLVSQRNAYGGFGSTQDTVVGLQALTSYAAGAEVRRGRHRARSSRAAGRRSSRSRPENADVLQIVDVPVGGAADGRGARARARWCCRRCAATTCPEAERKSSPSSRLTVDYGTDQVEVNDLIDVRATIKYTPPEPMQGRDGGARRGRADGLRAGGGDARERLKAQPKLKRYDIAGRKVIVYIEDMEPARSCPSPSRPGRSTR